MITESQIQVLKDRIRQSIPIRKERVCPSYLQNIYDAREAKMKKELAIIGSLKVDEIDNYINNIT